MKNTSRKTSKKHNTRKHNIRKTIVKRRHKGGNQSKRKIIKTKHRLVLDEKEKETLRSRMIITELARKVEELPSDKVYINSIEEIKRDLPLNKHLYDLIYENEPTLEKARIRLGKPDKIYDHGINNPETITAGIPGVHIYLLFNNNDKKWFQLNKKNNIVGVVIRTKK